MKVETKIEEPAKEAKDEEVRIKLSSAGLIFKHFGKEVIYNATN